MLQDKAMNHALQPELRNQSPERAFLLIMRILTEGKKRLNERALNPSKV
jgi:hypothetical protein